MDSRQMRTLARLAGSVSLVLVCLAGSSCSIFGGGGPAPQSEPLTVVLEGAEDLNTCGRDAANALAVRIYQLGASTAATAIPQARLWEADEEELAKDLVYRRELFLNPGTEQACELSGHAEAHYLMVAGNFCQTEGECWRWIGPMPEKDRKLTLRFGPTCIEQVGKK